MSDAEKDTGLPRHPVRLVSRRTGLSAHVLRVWERRYGVVKPVRSEGGQRLYSDADVERLRLLHLATRGGRNIGQLIGLSNETLRNLVQEDAAASPSTPGPPDSATTPAAAPLEAEVLLARAREAVPRLDASSLEGALRRAVLGLGVPAALDHVVVPLLEDIGNLWAEGRITPAHEHMASAVIRRVLDAILRDCTPATDAPALVVATPSGQVHELGALLAGASAAAEGWRVVYLGIDLPSEDITRVAVETRARAVGLSIVHLEPDSTLHQEIAHIAAALPGDCRVLLGGGAAPVCMAHVHSSRVEHVADLPSLRARLESLREPLAEAI